MTERPAPAVPEGLRVYAVGDVHGRADLLERLHKQIGADLDRHPPDEVLVVYLGDYVDRGPDTRGVVDRVLAADWPRVCLMGNHEDMMLAAMSDPESLALWLFNGGNATLESYGVGVDDPGHAGSALEAALPDAHRAFFADLALYHEVGDYLFVHAGLMPGRPLADQARHDLMWVREPFLSDRRDHGTMVVHGHTIRRGIDEQPNRIGIDTGAFATGHLTCVVLEGTTRRFLQT